MPVAAEEYVEDFIDLTSLGINNTGNRYFALKVQGDSMINAHILDGDTVVIKKQSQVESKDIAAVIWNGEATIKYLHRHGKGMLLVPANDNMQPIQVLPENTDSFHILGRVVTVIRHF
jgi:repressor LexA